MPKQIETIAKSLFSKIRARFPRVSLGDENAKATNDPMQAKFINFDFELDGQNIGNITISLIDPASLKVYYGSNITKSLDAKNRAAWFKFLRDLRGFAKMNMMSFDPRDIGRNSLQLNDIKNVAQHENPDHGLRESKDVSPLTGNTKTSSQMFGPVKIIINHRNKVNETVKGSRSRNIESIYLETTDRERFKMPHNSLSGARAMARHISNGGKVHDDFGNKINEMVNEMRDLAYFVRSAKRTVESLNEDETKTIVETAIQHYYNLKRKLSGLKGQKGYNKYKEDINGVSDNGNAMDYSRAGGNDSTSAMGGITPDYESYATTLKEKFTKKIFDDRFDAALPHIAKVYANMQHHDKMTESSIKQWMKSPSIKHGDTKMKKMSEFCSMTTEDTNDKFGVASKIFEFIALNEENDEIKTYGNTAKKWMSEASTDKKMLALEFATSYMRNLKTKSSPLQEYINELNKLSKIQIAETTWAKPDNEVKIKDLQKLLSKPLPFGVDGNNASSALYDILGDDELFDAFYNDSKTMGAKADARKTIEWFIRHNFPELVDQLDFTGKGVKPVKNDSEEAADTTDDTNTGSEDESDFSDMKKLAGL